MTMKTTNLFDCRGLRWCVAALLLLASVAVSAKDIRKVSVTPSTAKIYVDGNYAGDDIVEVTMQKKNRVVKQVEPIISEFQTCLSILK